MSNVIPLPRSESLARPLRAALYGRASRDRHKQGRSIKDQFTVGEMECADRGWQIVDRYEDRDRSATRRATKVRERFEELISDAEAGKFDVIVYAERSRISRNLGVSVALRDLCHRTGVLLCYDGRVYDMRRPADFKEFTRDSVQSEEEGESIIGRNERTARLTARRGGMWGWVPFGYKRVYDPETGELVDQVPHPVEGPVVVELFADAAERKNIKSLLSLVRPFRPDITETGIRAILRNKAYIGIRVHKGDEYKAAWKALVDEAVFWRVQQMLDDPDRRKAHTTGLLHLLTGDALCSVCRSSGNAKQGRLRPRGERAKYRVKPGYECNLGHVSIMEQKLDAFVEEAVLAWICSDEARAALQGTPDDGEAERERERAQVMARQLAEARRQATEFDPSTGLPRLSVASLADLEQRLIPMIQAAERRVRELISAGDPVLDRLLAVTPDEVDEIWNHELDLAQRRHVLREIVRVELRPAPNRSRYQEMGQRVGLIFAGEPGFTEWPDIPAEGGQQPCSSVVAGA
ncbi:recombinase family protein [Kitasatospora sp. NPDC056731]|uniref:recombinase family protein n=1 Tax=Kitasatospora sp. NPDC056731 TaxID=3155422 RepID=UPI00341BD964